MAVENDSPQPKALESAPITGRAFVVSPKVFENIIKQLESAQEAKERPLRPLKKEGIRRLFDFFQKA